MKVYVIGGYLSYADIVDQPNIVDSPEKADVAISKKYGCSKYFFVLGLFCIFFEKHTPVNQAFPPNPLQRVL